MKSIHLKGGMMHITDNADAAYEVLSGQVLVYILPYKDDKVGRRFLIHEAKEGEEIATLHFEHPQLGKWRFGLVALEEAELKEYQPEDLDEVKLNCAMHMGIRLFAPEEFEEQVVEQYNINIIKEEGYIYATSVEQKSTYEQGLQIIQEMFRKKKRYQRTEPSGNKVYDAVALICDFMNIRIAPFEVIKESCKRRLSVWDIGRISHFTCREVVLEEKWYKNDSGPILAYKSSGRAPIACIPKGPHKYLAYDLTDGTQQIIDEEYAKKLEIKADMVYRPFPAEEITLRKLIGFGFKGAYIRDFVNFGLLALLGTIIGMLLPIMNQQLYDKFIPMADKSGLIQICMVVLSCSVGNLAFTVVKNLATFRSMNSMEYAVQSATYDRLFNLPESFFRQYESADLAQRTMGITAIFQVMADVMLKSILSAFFSFLYLWRMFSYSSKLALTSLFMVLVVMVVVGFIGYRQLKYEGEQLELKGKISSIMYQFLSGIAKIRIAGVENRALVEYLKPYAKSRKINIRKEKMSVVVNAIAGSAMIVFNIVLFYVMVNKEIELSMGAFMGFMTAFGLFANSMIEMVSSFLDVNNAIPAYKRCQPILKALPEYEEDTIMPGNLSGEIEVNNLSFAYDKEMGNVLEEVSFHIKPGEYIGVVGASGGGKSTLLKLLLGFEKAQQGKVFYDGKDIDGMDKRELRKKFGVVLQDGDLISGSIYDNIVITAPNTTKKRVDEVIKKVGLEKDIAQMPMGLHTILSENSGTISGGQQQRILIARAIVGNPKILFFDEATSALDNITQAMVCESLEKLNTTRIVIAHRLSTIMTCDRIFVMDKGRIVESGSYQQLIDQGGLFSRLASRQMA